MIQVNANTMFQSLFDIEVASQALM